MNKLQPEIIAYIQEFWSDDLEVRDRFKKNLELISPDWMNDENYIASIPQKYKLMKRLVYDVDSAQDSLYRFKTLCKGTLFVYCDPAHHPEQYRLNETRALQARSRRLLDLEEKCQARQERLKYQIIILPDEFQ